MSFENESRLKIARRIKQYAIFNIDPQGLNVSWNEGVRQILGYDEDEWLAKEARVIFTEEDQASGAYLRELETAKRDGSAGDDRGNVRKDGTRFWANGVLTAGYDAEGNLQGYVKILQDRTEELRTAQEREENAEKLHALAENMSQFAWLADSRGHVHWFNRRWLEYTGLRPEEMTEHKWLMAVHPDRREEVAEGFFRSLEAGRAWEDTYALRRFDGVYRTFLSRSIPLRDDSGEVVRWIGTNTDVTEQLATQRSLEQALIQLDSAVQSGRVVTWMWDVQNDRVTGNEMLARLFSVGREEMQSGVPVARIFDAVHPVDRDSVREALQLAIELDNEYSLEFRVVLASGRIHWVHARGNAQYDQLGRPLRISGVLVDITEQKEAQERLKELNRLFEHQYSLLDYALSHTLRAPLRAINGFSNLLAEEFSEAVGEQGREYLSRIASAATRLGSVMDAMVQLARLPRQKP